MSSPRSPRLTKRTVAEAFHQRSAGLHATTYKLLPWDLPLGVLYIVPKAEYPAEEA
ncbi:hypothetical protein GLOTRDRAFT_125354 [Gloeophyllum trabeum ATCC 11539]|uniref:Uncharacterized protein n=1 Tax=Gloeophyllum trabeum (strain ATCC 11539 / FP-39264 / Madison 617) TaxID=670483 RepID=S7QIH2_GLOTA|nr:uncharacterized protein GLOTRDRAFT_125354 [Gloeophyllum trabeum ATCC 11539]EPQ59038.1 hypothetical protein GLOTRDRAFT_125354 [Gloeophyllum trabeum ATCC 11539]